MHDNTRTAIGYICIALVFITWLLLLGWIASPSEFIIKFEIDNNTKSAIESIEYPIVEYESYNNTNYCANKETKHKENDN